MYGHVKYPEWLVDVKPYADKILRSHVILTLQSIAIHFFMLDNPRPHTGKYLENVIEAKKKKQRMQWLGYSLDLISATHLKDALRIAAKPVPPFPVR